MKTIVRIVLVLFVLALTCSGVALADGDDRGDRPPMRATDTRPQQDSPFPKKLNRAYTPYLPTPGPVVPPGTMSASGSSSAAQSTLGNALVTPRGGAIATPQQQANRQIQRLIKNLN